MRRTLRGRALALVCAIGLLLTPLATTATAEAKPTRPAKPVTVMTRNLYLGADINRPVLAALAAQQAGGTTAQVLVALANATHVTRAIVDRTNYPVRSGLLADEIDRTEPELIGLQEVALWRSGPLELDPALVGKPNATHVDYDFLALLLAELAERGEQYTAVSVAPRADVEAPSFTGTPPAIGGTVRDVRLTMRDVVLMRVEDGLTATGQGQAVYTHNLAVTIAGATMNFDRGYQWVDVRAGAQRFRFINTHLEAFSSDLALAQAQELLANAPAAGKTNVFVCDCNSDPLNISIKPIDHVPHKAPYDLITGAGGFTDQWLEWAPANQGWTSGLNETVDEPLPGSWTHRIDMVFGRSASGDALGVDRGQVTGRDGDPRDPATGLWPSDHAGVVLRLRGL